MLGTIPYVLGTIPRVLGTIPRVLGTIPRVLGTIPRVLGTTLVAESFSITIGRSTLRPSLFLSGALLIAFPTLELPPAVGRVVLQAYGDHSHARALTLLLNFYWQLPGEDG